MKPVQQGLTAEYEAGQPPMGVETEERKVAVREWRRLKRIPQGSVEQGVIRNYVSDPTTRRA